MPSGSLTPQQQENKKEKTVDHDDHKGKPKMGAFRAILASTKFRKTLRRLRSGNKSSLIVQDVRDVKDQKAVEEFRRVLMANDLLPQQHDDYHILLRFASIALALYLMQLGHGCNVMYDNSH